MTSIFHFKRYLHLNICEDDLDLLESRDVMECVTILFDYKVAISYRGSIATEPISSAVFVILSEPKHIGVTTLTFHGYMTSSVMRPFNSPYKISY